jgi:hypothetical protein
LRKAAAQKPFVHGGSIGLRPRPDAKAMREGMEEEGRANLPNRKEEEEKP